MDCHPRAQALFDELSRKYPAPKAVQLLLRKLSYNSESHHETVRSAYQAWLKKRAHCLEAAFLSAAILERHGYPPLVLSLESQDNLDHVLYVFRESTGWGAIGRSRDEGLHGRAPVFRTVRDLVWSYFDPYVDGTGRVTGYGVANLEDTGTRWRDSDKNVWQAEQYLIDLKHEKLVSSNERYKKLLDQFHEGKSAPPQPSWW
jgi:hypothetical protein